MRTAPRYHRPESVAEAVEALGSVQDAAPLAGGTDLMNDMRLGLSHPELVVDSAGLTDLQSFHLGDDDGAVLGAGTTMASLLRSAEVASRYPALIDAAALLGGRQMQAVATLGGNLCHASPAAETATPLLVLDAVALIVGPGGRREVKIAEFWRGARASCLRPDELLVELRIPVGVAAEHSAYRRLELRRSVDIAVVSVSARLEIASGVVTDARVAIGAAAPTPRRVSAAEEALLGIETADVARLRKAVAAAAVACRSAGHPIDDTRASAQYRSAMVEVIAARCVDAALAGDDPIERKRSA